MKELTCGTAERLDRGLILASWSLVREKNPDHWTRCGKRVTRALGCLQKSGAGGKECNGEEGLKGRWGLDEK